MNDVINSKLPLEGGSNERSVKGMGSREWRKNSSGFFGEMFEERISFDGN